MILGDALLEGVLRASKDAILAFEAVRDAAGRIVDFRCLLANAAAERLLPRRDGPWAGASLTREVALLHAPELMQAFVGLTDGGAALDRDQAVPGLDGTAWMRIAAERAGDGFIAVLSGAPNGGPAQDSLTSADRVLQAAFDTIPLSVFVKDRDSHYVRVNRAMAELWHRPVEAFIGARVIAQEERPASETRAALETDRQVLDSGETMDRVLVQTLPDGGVRRLRVKKSPLYDVRRSIVGIVGTVEDVTERLAMEEALRTSEQRFRDLVEGSLQGMAILRDNRIVFGNPAYLRMFGFESLEEAQRSGTVLDFIAPEDRERIRGYIVARRSGQAAPDSYEMALLRKDQSRFSCHTLVRVVHWDGKPATQLTFFEITDRKRAEQALRASQRLLQSVLDTLPHAVFVKDLRGRFLLVNAVKAAYHGLKPEALAGRTSQELPWPDQIALTETLRAERKAQATGQASVIDEIETFDVLGERSFRKLIQLPLVDERGQLEGTVGISLDITAEVTARHQAEVAHAQLADAIESFPGAIALYDDRDRLFLWNTRALEFWGDASGGLGVGTPYEKIVRIGLEKLEGMTGMALEERVRSLIESFHQPSRSREFRRSDGRWFRSLANRMSSGGTVVVVIETSEAHRQDEELRQAQKMEAVGQLTGGIAHDFNNLLTVILGNADFLQETLRGDAPAMACARMITQAAQQGSALTQRLLSFARRQSLQPVELDLDKTVSGMGELIRRTLGEQIEIELIRGGGLWMTLADPSQLESALLNLAVNARDAMPQGGKLTIETANAWLDDAYASTQADVQPGQYVLLSVTDTGHGMARDVAERAFDPFFTTKGAGKGTGLGLSMVYGFVKQSGGHIKIYSESGQGTSVKIYLPRYLGPPQGAEPQPLAGEGPLPVGAETILVVEDDELVRSNTVQQLRSLGYQVVAVEDARRALELLDRLERVHLLFTDVVMPGMNGPQLAHQAQRIRPGLKVLFASGYTPNALVHQDRLDSGMHLVSKPYRKAELAWKVRRVLDE